MKSSVFIRIITYIGIVLLAFVNALSYTLFIVPNRFAPAGINGIATMIQYKAGFSIGYMSLIVNVPLCIFSFFTTSKRFALRTFLFCICYSCFYLFLQKQDLSAIVYDAGDTDTIFPCLIAGMIAGTIYSACFRLSSSTGGTDIVAKYINMRDKKLNFFWVTFALNAAVAAASFFVYAKEEGGHLVYDYKPVCLCLLYCFTSSFVGNRLMQGTRQAYHFVIVTEHPAEIEKEVLAKLHHSATRLEATGAFSHEERAVLLCVINRHQTVELKEILSAYDRTFAYVEPVTETIGNFKKISQFSRE